MKKENEKRLILDPPCKFRQSVSLDDATRAFVCLKGVTCKECKEKGLGYEPMERATEQKARQQKEAAQRIGFRLGQMAVYYGFSVLFLAALAVIFRRPFSLFRILSFVAVMDFLQEFRDYCFRENPPRTF